MGNAKDNIPVSEYDADRLIEAVDKLQKRKFTPTEEAEIRKIATRAGNYQPKKLPQGSKSAVVNMYLYYKYGVVNISKDANSAMPISMDKGSVKEADAIKLVNDIHGWNFVKNEEVVSNTFFTGIPDILLKSKVKSDIVIKEIKIPLTLNQFVLSENQKLDTDIEWQMLAYLDILKADYVEIFFCLVDAPLYMINQEKKKVMERMLMAGNNNDIIMQRLKMIEKSMTFGYIEKEKRVRKVIVERNDIKMRDARVRVKQLREYLLELHSKMQFFM